MIIFAPNIHTGGGFTLLQGLLRALRGDTDMVLFLDSRIREKVEQIDPLVKIYWVRKSVGSRLRAEKQLRKISNSTSHIICFNGVPPLMKCQGTVWVYVQNRLLIDDIRKYQFRRLVRLRIIYEKLVFYMGRRTIARYLVQTPTMAESLIHWLERRGVTTARSKVSISPFFDFETEEIMEKTISLEEKLYDFCYVADGGPHKNHENLLQALILLARQGVFPNVALTLGPLDQELIGRFMRAKEEHDLKIDNLGILQHKDVMNLYAQSRALIHPSLLESFGLPLIEATRLNLPIVAAELDHVRDICCPRETFDPNSPRSISRAIRRFQNLPEDSVEIQTSSQFLESIRLDMICE